MFNNLFKMTYCFLLLAMFGTGNVIAKGVVLTIKEQTAPNGSQKELSLTLKQLQALPQVEITTHTRWTQGEKHFKGPLLRDVLALKTKQFKQVKAVAINGYRVDIPSQDYLNYDVILALYEGGKPLTLRTKGPIWIIYPWSDLPELEQGIYYARAVWQLSKLEVYD